MRRTIKNAVAGMGITLVSLSAFAQPTLPETAVSQTWVSKYVSQGRNNLETGGLSSFEASATLGNVTTAFWYGTGSETDYSEMSLAFEYGLELLGKEAYVSYARIAFPEDDESDNEIGAGLSLDAIGSFTPALDYYHSTGAEGGFLELSLTSEKNYLNGDLVVESYLVEGVDFGYASAEHDGANHLALGVNMNLTLNDNFELFASAEQTFAQEDITREGGEDVAWMSVGISGSF